MRGARVWLIGLVGLWGAGAPPAHAAPITYEFSGVIDFVDASTTAADPRFGMLQVGDTFKGSFVYDTNASGLSGTFACPAPPPAGVVPCGIDLNIAGIDFATDPEEVFRFTPGTSTTLGPDLFFFQGATDTPVTDIAGLPPVLALNLIDPSNAMPLSQIPVQLDLDDFTTRELRFVYRTGPGGGPVSNAPFVSGTLQTLILLPEPSTVSLVALGIAGIAARRRRSARRRPVGAAGAVTRSS